MRNKDGVGEIEYWLRGESLGIAFSRIDLRKYVWYPAASFATDQMCAFNFGAFPFQYRLPNNFTSVQCSIADRNILKETREEMIDKMATVGARFVDVQSSWIGKRVGWADAFDDDEQTASEGYS